MGTYYIYTLSFNGIPFYCGMTKDPANRFKTHYRSFGCRTFNYIRYNLLEFGKLAEMSIICKVQAAKNDALKIEANVIQSLNKAGFVLLNKDWNYADQTKYPPHYDNYNRLPHGSLNGIEANIERQKENVITYNGA